jgi:prepilin signal peptidase PulO-like enzyme (type II secretory pathway)
MVFLTLPFLAFIAAMGGSLVAAAWDLKTTEIPDEISYVMIVLGLVLNAAISASTGSVWPLLSCVISGAGLFAFGFVMYYLGQWGGGDAKILSAIGFLLPSFTGMGDYAQAQPLFFPFPLSYLFNVFFVGAGYMMVYAFAMAMRNRKIISAFVTDVKASSRMFLIGSVALLAVIAAINYYIHAQSSMAFDGMAIAYNSVAVVALTIALYGVWKFAKAVEKIGFVRRIPISRLQVGDVPLDSKLWEGLTLKEVKKIKASGKRFISIKEGVRFAPAFPLALLFTLFFGDAIMLLFRLFG